MNIFLVITVQLLTYLKITTQQYYPNNFPVQFQQNPGQRYLDSQSGDDEEEIPYRFDHRKNKYHGSHEKYDRADDCQSSEECICPCNKCDDPPRRCKDECDTCLPETERHGITGSQPNLIFVPVPYIVMMPSNNSTRNPLHAPATLSTEQTTTRETTTTRQPSTTTTATPSTAPVGLLSGPSSCYDTEPVSGQSYRRSPNMESRNITPIRRTRPTWMPKYGIMPIPDRLAEKLMYQLREIKDLRRRP